MMMEPQSEDQQPTEMELLKKQEDEHLRLQRQVRMIQLDREHRTMGVHPQFRIQDHLLWTLKKEYINLQKDLKISRSGAHKKNDRILKNRLRRSLKLHVKFDQEYNEGLDQMDQLDGLYDRNTDTMLELRKLVENSQGQQEERKMLSELRLRTTENKLEIAMLRFNKVQGENREIRECIEHMLKDRAIFNQNWGKMITALSKGKKFLQDLFESSSVAYDQRDEWCRKLRSLQEKGKIDQTVQVQEMRDLQKTLDNEMKLYDFLAHKGVIRVNKKQEQREIDEKIEKEKYYKKEIEVHGELLDSVSDYADEPNIERIIEEFERVESHNFSIYVLNAEYISSNIFLKKELDEVFRELEERRSWNYRKEQERQEKLEKLSEVVEEEKTKTEDLRREVEEASATIERAVGAIADMFSLLECSLEPFQNLLGDKEPSIWTLPLTLSLITERIQELVQMAYFCEKFKLVREDLDKSKSRLKKQFINFKTPGIWIATPLHKYVMADPCSNCVEARWLAHFCETLEVPFDRELTLQALDDLIAEPAYERSDRLHPLTDCKLPKSRLLLAKRYV